MREKQNIIDIFKFFSFLFDSNDVSATNAFEKITVTSDGSNNSGVWGRSPQPPEANGDLGAEAPTQNVLLLRPQGLRRENCYSFSKKLHIFKFILV